MSSNVVVTEIIACDPETYTAATSLPSSVFFYSHTPVSGVPTGRKYSPAVLRVGLAPIIQTTQITYIPTATGNTANLGEFVQQTGDGPKGYIDGSGNYFEFPTGGGGSITGTQGSILFIGDDGNSTEDDENFFWDDVNNRLGIGNNSPRAPIHIGEIESDPSGNSVVIINRAISGTANIHGYTDGTVYTLTGGASCNSYDARVDFTGTTDMGHFAAFQSAPTFAHTGTVAELYSFVTSVTQSSGVLAKNYGFRIVNVSQTGGSVTDNYPIYITAQNHTITGENVGVFISNNITTTATRNVGVLIENQGSVGTALLIENQTDGTVAADIRGQVRAYMPSSSGDVVGLLLDRQSFAVGDKYAIMFKASTVEYAEISAEATNGADGAIVLSIKDSASTPEAKFRVDKYLQAHDYGQGNKSATDLSKTGSRTICEFANDGTFLERPVVTPAVSTVINYAAQLDDETIFVDATSGNINVTLTQLSSMSGKCYKIIKTDSTSNTVSVTANTGSVFGVISTSTQYKKLELTSDGTNYYSVS